MNDFGRLGGSNIVPIKISIANIIPDGDFESVTSLSHWEVSALQAGGTVKLDRGGGHGGQGSLHMTAWSEAKLIQPIAIQKDVAYQLSWFTKLAGQRNNIDDLWIGIYQGPDIVVSFTVPAQAGGPRPEADADGWAARAKETFSVTKDGGINIKIHNYSDELWLDDLILQPVANE